MTDTPRILDLPLDQIVPTPDNPRRPPAKNDPKLRELADSIKALGLLQPVLVRVSPLSLDPKRETYDLRAGRRRFEACKLAGLTTIRAEVHDWDDQQALEVTIAENLDRDDLTPLEEARGCQLLLTIGHDIKAAAARLGQTESWIRRRAHLCHLSPAWMAELDQPDSPYTGWGATYLELIAKLQPADQDALIKEWAKSTWNRPTTIDRLRDAITKRVCSLADAVFDVDSVCQGCVKRGSSMPYLPGLFEPENSKKKPAEECLDYACYKRCSVVAIAKRLEPLVAKHPELRIVLDNTFHDAIGHKPKGLPPTISSPWMMKNAKEGSKGAIPVVRIEGTGKPGKVAWKKERSSAYSSGQKRESTPEVMAQLALERVLDQRERAVREAFWSAITKIKELPAFTAIEIIAWILLKDDLEEEKHGDVAKTIENLNKSNSSACEALWTAVQTHLNCPYNEPALPREYGELTYVDERAIARLLRIEPALNDIIAKAEKKHPDPALPKSSEAKTAKKTKAVKTAAKAKDRLILTSP